MFGSGLVHWPWHDWVMTLVFTLCVATQLSSCLPGNISGAVLIAICPAHGPRHQHGESLMTWPQRRLGLAMNAIHCIKVNKASQISFVNKKTFNLKIKPTLGHFTKWLGDLSTVFWLFLRMWRWRHVGILYCKLVRCHLHKMWLFLPSFCFGHNETPFPQNNESGIVLPRYLLSTVSCPTLWTELKKLSIS